MFELVFGQAIALKARVKGASDQAQTHHHQPYIVLARRSAIQLLQSSFRRVRRILSLFTYALHVSAEAVNRVASCGRAQKD
jgi:hypothetical protein